MEHEHSNGRPATTVQAMDDRTDMLGELRVLLPTAQLLSPFLE